MKAALRLLILVSSLNTAIAGDLTNRDLVGDVTGQQQPVDTSVTAIESNQAGKDKRPTEKITHDLSDSKPLGLAPSGQAIADVDLAPSPSTSSIFQQETQQTGSVKRHATVGNEMSAVFSQVVRDSDLGFHSPVESSTVDSNHRLFDLLHDQARLMLGEEVYAKIAWTYFDLKQVDEWIYSTTSQISLDGYQRFFPFSSLFRLDEHLQAGVVLGTAEQKQWLNQNNTATLGLGSQSAQAVLADYQKSIANVDRDNDSFFFSILKYLTILNLLYGMLAGLALVFLGKGFNFLIRLNGVRNGSK